MMEHFKVRTLTLVSDETLTTGASVGKASIDACTTVSTRVGITVINIINCNKFKTKWKIPICSVEPVRFFATTRVISQLRLKQVWNFKWNWYYIPSKFNSLEPTIFTIFVFPICFHYTILTVLQTCVVFYCYTRCYFWCSGKHYNSMVLGGLYCCLLGFCAKKSWTIFVEIFQTL